MKYRLIKDLEHGKHPVYTIQKFVKEKNNYVISYITISSSIKTTIENFNSDEFSHVISQWPNFRTIFEFNTKKELREEYAEYII
jgi:hypothetical protein